jgi:hypothetical protein
MTSDKNHNHSSPNIFLFLVDKYRAKYRLHFTQSLEVRRWLKVHNCYSLQNIIRVAKSRMRRMGHVERMMEMRNKYKISVANVKGKVTWQT